MSKQSNEETIHGYLPNDYQIIKRKEKDGTIVFMHPTGDKVSTYKIDLYSFLRTLLDPIQSLFRLVDDDSEAGFICESLIDHAVFQFEEAFSFIDRSLGIVKIEIVSAEERSVYRIGQVVQITLEPPKEGGAS